MTKVGRVPGLIRYDSPAGLAGGDRRILRPRLVLYTVLLVAGAVVAFFATRTRTDFEVTASRLRGAPYTVDAGALQNAFDLHLVNKRGERQAFLVSVEGPAGADVVLPVSRVQVEALADAHVPVFIMMPQALFHGDSPARFRVSREASAGRDVVLVAVAFLGAAK
jgi:polyferredoxin